MNTKIKFYLSATLLFTGFAFLGQFLTVIPIFGFWKIVYPLYPKDDFFVYLILPLFLGLILWCLIIFFALIPIMILARKMKFLSSENHPVLKLTAMAFFTFLIILFFYLYFTGSWSRNF